MLYHLRASDFVLEQVGEKNHRPGLVLSGFSYRRAIWIPTIPWLYRRFTHWKRPSPFLPKPEGTIGGIILSVAAITLRILFPALSPAFLLKTEGLDIHTADRFNHRYTGTC